MVPRSETLTTALASVHRHEVIVLLAAGPVFLFPSPGRAVAVLIIPALAWIAHRNGRPWLPPTPLNAALLCLTAAVFVSLAATADPVFSLPKVMGLAYGIACFFAVVRWMGASPRHFAWARAAFIVVPTAYAGFALAVTNWITKIPIFATVTDRLPRLLPQLDGAEGGLHPNAIAGILILFIPAQIALVLDGRPRDQRTVAMRRARWLQSGALALTLVTVVLTQSRGAWVGLAAGLFGLGMAYGPAARRTMALIVLVAGLGLVVAGPGRTAALVVARGGLKPPVVGRYELWSRALAAIGDFPFTGVGMNMFRRVVPVLYPTALVVPDMRQDVVHAHNQFLQVALDLGVPGLIAYLALWLGTGNLLIAAYRAAGTPADRRLLVGLAMGLTAHALFGVGDTIALGAKVGLLFWLMLAFVVGTCLTILAGRRTRSMAENPS